MTKVDDRQLLRADFDVGLSSELLIHGMGQDAHAAIVADGFGFNPRRAQAVFVGVDEGGLAVARQVCPNDAILGDEEADLTFWALAIGNRDDLRFGRLRHPALGGGLGGRGRRGGLGFDVSEHILGIDLDRMAHVDVDEAAAAEAVHIVEADGARLRRVARGIDADIFGMDAEVDGKVRDAEAVFTVTFADCEYGRAGRVVFFALNGDFGHGVASLWLSRKGFSRLKGNAVSLAPERLVAY